MVKYVEGAEEMTQSEKFLLCKHKDLCLDPQHPPNSQVLQVYLKQQWQAGAWSLPSQLI